MHSEMYVLRNRMKCIYTVEARDEEVVVDSGDKLIHHSGPILSHLVRDKFGYSVVDKSTSLACS